MRDADREALFLQADYGPTAVFGTLKSCECRFKLITVRPSLSTFNYLPKYEPDMLLIDVDNLYDLM